MTSELPFLSRLRIFDEIAENAQNDHFFAIFLIKIDAFLEIFIWNFLNWYQNKSNSNSNGRETRPLSRFANSISVEELNNLTRQINLQTSR